MKKAFHHLSLLIVFFFIHQSQAQWQNDLWIGKQANNWYFCLDAGLDFNSTPVIPVPDSKVSSQTYYWTDLDGNIMPSTAAEGYGGSAVMSDEAGNLLFYTDGKTVWNKNHDIMANGTDIISSPYGKQNTLIVPAPGNPDKYFIFSIKTPDHYTFQYPFPLPSPLYSWRVVYSEVDMSLENGLGGITVNKNVVLAGIDEPTFLAGSYYGRISATYHADGEKIWVMTHGIGNNEFRAFLVSEAGVSTTPVVSAIGSFYDGYPDTMAQMKFSPDGTMIAKSLMLYDEGKNVEVFKFDKNSGLVTDILVTIGQQEFINDGEFVGAQGLEFSPNSKLLYTAGCTSGIIKQFNLTAGDEAAIKASGVALNNLVDPVQFNHYMQAGPDGKIYVAFSEDAFGGFGSPMALSTINVIDYPNNVGLAANFTPNAIDLGSSKSAHCFPSFIQDYFASGILHEEHCESFATKFTTLRIPGITYVTWNFGDPQSGADNSSDELEPSHIFTSAGTYTVTAVITSNGVQQVATSTVTILPKPDISIPESDSLAKCDDGTGSAIFSLNELDTEILNGLNASDYTITYYASAQDIELGIVINPATSFRSAGKTIFAVVTNNATGCTSTVEFELVVNPLPLAGIPNNIEECGSTSLVAIFDLTEQSPVILGDLDNQLYSVSFYSDQGYTNSIQQPDMFESAGQTIYAKLTDNTTGCFVGVEFSLNVLLPQTLPEIPDYTGCSPFDLIAIVGEPEAGTTFSFYLNEDDALSASNEISNANNFIIKENTGNIYVRAEDIAGCIQVGVLSIFSGDCFMPRGISPNGDGKNDSFNLSGFDVKLLKVFNRYGQEVYSKANYISEWMGQSASGEELPTGTYFFMIEKGDGSSDTGWVYINRQE